MQVNRNLDRSENLAIPLESGTNVRQMQSLTKKGFTLGISMIVGCGTLFTGFYIVFSWRCENKNKNFYCPIEGPQGAKSLQWFINNNIKKYKMCIEWLWMYIASCYRFSCYYRFSDIAINSVNPSFIWRLEWLVKYFFVHKIVFKAILVF